MISMYKWQQVKVLSGNGASIKEIARRLKLSRNTVRKYLRRDGPPEFKKRCYRKVLESYDKEIQEMLAKGFIGTRMHRELLGMGIDVSLSSVYRYIKGIREEEKIKDKVTTRVETAPGRQMQYDWKEWNLSVGGQKVKVYIHELILSYSRKKYYTFSLSITCQDVIRALVRGIEYFGGVAPELVIDNAKQMVITHNNNGVIRYNEEFLKFCGLYGIDLRPCGNYRARTKGKVERPFYYIQEHLLRGLHVESLSEFEERIRGFTQEYNNRVHSTLKESSEERFSREKEHLRDIPSVEPRLLWNREQRKVTNDGYIWWKGRLYPVPMRYCIRDVMIEDVFGRLIRVYDVNGCLIAEHERDISGIKTRPLHPEHEAMNKAFNDKRKRIRSALVGRFISLFGEIGARYIEGLKDNTGANLYWHLEQILSCCDVYEVDVVKRAIEECSEIGSYHKNSVIRVLCSSQLKESFKGMPFKGLPLTTGTDITRPLSAYCVLKEVRHE